MGSNGKRRRLAVAAATAVLMTAATPASVGAGSGEPAQPTELRLGVTGGWEWRVDPLVAALGGGTVTARIDFDWQEAHLTPDMEQQIVAAVASGELDLGFVGTRAFTELGVTGLSALTAPLLIDSYALQEAVFAGDLPERLLPTVDAAGVNAIAIVPGPLRRPLGIERAFVAPSDFAGATFHTFHAAGNAATAVALGAEHIDVFGPTRDEMFERGEIDVTENSLDWMRGNGRAPFGTLGVGLWPATAALVINPDVLAGLPGEQRQSLVAAVASFASVDDFAAGDVALAAEICAGFGQLVSAAPDDVEALRATVAPVYAELSTDSATADVIAEIEVLQAGIDPTAIGTPDDCPDGGATTVTVPESTDDPAVLNGVYRFEWTAEGLMEAMDISESDARGNAGEFVLAFADGIVEQRWESDGSVCRGTYSVVADRVVMIASNDITEWDCGGDTLGVLLVDARFEVTDEQLVLTDFVLSDEPDVTWFLSVYLGEPMTRIG